MKKGNLVKKKNRKWEKRVFGTFLSIGLIVGLVGCETNNNSSKENNDSKIIQAVAAENEYGSVLKQIGGKYISVTSIMSNPETDPHSYESSTEDSEAVSKAALVVQNGLGYDDFMGKLEASSKNSNRTIIDVSKELGYSTATKNPHIWFKPDTMKKLANIIEKELEKKQTNHKSYFEDNLSKFDKSLDTFNNNLQKIKDAYQNVGVAVTEPVSDYMLEAAGLDIKTPWDYQAAVMNGTDPSPQNVKVQEDLFKNKKVKVFLYNQQAVDDSTKELLKLAKDNNIPIVGVYETMPLNHTYQTWMEAESEAVYKALKYGVSTEKIS